MYFCDFQKLYQTVAIFEIFFIYEIIYYYIIIWKCQLTVGFTLQNFHKFLNNTKPYMFWNFEDVSFPWVYSLAWALLRFRKYWPIKKFKNLKQSIILA